jgi:hypothetical protein
LRFAAACSPAQAAKCLAGTEQLRSNDPAAEEWQGNGAPARLGLEPQILGDQTSGPRLAEMIPMETGNPISVLSARVD